MAWVYLDDQFPDHPKVVAAGGDAGWLFVCGLAYVKRYATDGSIPKAKVPRLSDRKAPNRLAQRLVEVGLWEDDGGNYRVHDYRQWNKPQESRSAAARKAAEARWAKDAKRNANASSNAYADASESHSDEAASADASGCPPPLTPTDENKSSDKFKTPDEPTDDDHPDPTPPIVAQAIAILAAKDLSARQGVTNLGPVGDPVSWQNAAYDRRLAAPESLIQLHHEHPDWDAQQIADSSETCTAVSDDLDHKLDGQQVAARARAERNLRVIAGETCQACHDTGWTTDQDGLAVPCRCEETP